VCCPADIVDAIDPSGEKELPAGVAYIRDEEHQWCYGAIEGVTAEQMAQLKQVLVDRKKAFAYQHAGACQGYSGPPAEIPDGP
jgi:hypothetical protein